MGCNCCKEVNHADYKKCQQDIDRILRNCKTTSSKQYLLLMASLLHLMQRLQCQKRRNVKIEDKAMTREEAKTRAELYLALGDGKEIQVQNPVTCEWKYLDINQIDGFNEELKYRIKPEPKYRPFKSKEECWNEILKHQPFGWVKEISSEMLYLINGISDMSIVIMENIDSFKEAMNIYEFKDGAPFGVVEE